MGMLTESSVGRLITKALQDQTTVIRELLDEQRKTNELLARLLEHETV